MPLHNSMVGGPAASYGQQAPMSGYPQTQVQSVIGNAMTPGSRVIDGTPLRVVTFAAIGVGGLLALKWAGFKFNVTAGV